eukprot:m.420842 g.420842  ORF g.420842 m.420842 type:complete len:64 (+) comp16846_c2_seq32:7309-7500(+)
MPGSLLSCSALKKEADPAVIERAICDRLRLDRGSRFELTDSDRIGVAIDGNLVSGNYIVEVIK